MYMYMYTTIIMRTQMYCNLLQHKASQMWCLARFLPLLIGDKVLDDDERWHNFLTLLEIVDRVLAPVTSMSIIADLQHLINLHHSEFKRLYPNNSITPKMHFLVHYPELMARYAHTCSYIPSLRGLCGLETLGQLLLQPRY